MYKIIDCTALVFLSLFFTACSKNNGGSTTPDPTPTPSSFALNTLTVNGTFAGFTYKNASLQSAVRLSFFKPLNTTTVPASISFQSTTGGTVTYSTSFENSDSAIVLRPVTSLTPLTVYNIAVSTALKAKDGGLLQSAFTISLTTSLDSSRKFPAVPDSVLLTLVQQQTFKYFWDFGHPTSGLARERNTSGDLVTSGGSGFGIMTIPVGIYRGFITRAQGLARLQTTVAFLKNTAQTFHGSFPHWLNGATGVVIPFSTKDNGADLVETAYLMQGLLTARQYFDGTGAEAILRADIDTIWRRVEWNWFRKGTENVLYWHWSPNYNWDMNVPIKGWNECLITYVLAAASPTYSIPKAVYDAGWAGNGSLVNGNPYFGVQLPLGPARGGPLFFAHYSFLGIKPTGLSDGYANYLTQNRNHTLINYNYCVANPLGQPGYSDSIWGLTASDIPNGYSASSPTNDLGVIAPTAALSSFPYTPIESMKALKFFYYVLGDKLFKQYGFVDAFSMKDIWFADSFLAIDQGPIILMIENYRTGLLWNLFTSAAEVKTGMLKLGFTAPYL